MKKIAALFLCGVMALTMVACAPTNDQEPNPQDKPDDLIQISNPFVSCDTLEEAAQLAGFVFVIPREIPGYEQEAISAIEKELIQVIFRGEADAKLSLRKGVGSEDISGDYNVYPQVDQVSVGERTVTMKGEGGTVMVAVWSLDGYAYAIRSQGMSQEEMTGLVESIA